MSKLEDNVIEEIDKAAELDRVSELEMRLQEANNTISQFMKDVEYLKSENQRLVKTATVYRSALLCLAKEIN